MLTTNDPKPVKQTPPHMLRLTLIFGALTAFAPFATDMYLASFPTLSREFGTDLAHVQMSLSVFFFGMAAGQVFYGPLIDRFGRKVPLLIGIGIFAVSSMLLVVVPNIEAFILLRLLQAIGGCAGMIVSRVVINDLYEPRKAAHVLSLMMLVTGLGPIIAPILGGYVLVLLGWKAIFLFLVAFSLVCLAATFFGLPETLPPQARSRAGIVTILGNYSRLLTNRSFIIPTFSGSLAFCGLFAFITGSPFVFMSLYGVSQAHYGWLFGTNAVALIIGSQINGVLLRHFSPAKLLMGGLLFYIVAAALLVLVRDDSSLIVFLIPLWLCLGTIPSILANSTALAMNASGRHGGSGSAIIGVLQFGLASIISALVSLLYNGTALPMTGAILAAGVLAVLTLVLGSKR